MKRLIGLVTSSGARDTYLLTAGNILDSIIAFAFTIICFKLLSPSDFGLFSAFNNLVFSASLILDLGISQALLYYLPHQSHSDQKTTIGSAVALRLLFAGIISLFLILFSHSVSQSFFPGSQTVLVVIAALAIITSSFIDVLIYAFQGLRRFFLSVVVSDTYSLTRLLAVLAFIFFALPFRVHQAMTITLFGPLIGIAISLFFLRPYFPKKDQIKKLIGFGGYMGVYRVSQIITLRSDIQIVLINLGAGLAGIYSVAARMANFYPLIIITLNSLFASRLRLQDKLSLDFLKKSSFLLILILLVMSFCAWEAPLIIRILFGTKASDAGLIYRYLTLAYLPLMAATLPVAILVFYHASTKFMALIGLLQVTTMLVLSSLLVTRFSQFGPVIALSVANSLVFVLSCYKVMKIWK